MRSERRLCRPGNLLVYVDCQRLDTLGESLDRFRQLRILSDKIEKNSRLFGCNGLALIAGPCQILAMQRISFSVRLVSISLTGLREKYQRRCVGGL